MKRFSRGPKYNAKKIECDGIIFDSKREMNRWKDLRALEAAGKISGLQRQVRFELIPSQVDPDTGEHAERPVYYYADFVYTENGRKVIEDTKGFKTPEYIIKRKLILQKFHIRIRET